jgi:hypothetical protein
MRQLCAVDLVGFDTRDFAFHGSGTEGPKPDRGLVGRTHVLLGLPQAHGEHLALLRVAEEQTATVAGLHPEGRDEVLFDRTLPLWQTLQTHFVALHMESPIMSYWMVARRWVFFRHEARAVDATARQVLNGATRLAMSRNRLGA